MTSCLPICLWITVFSPALDKTEYRNFEAFGSLQAKRGRWSPLESLHCNGWNFPNWGQIIWSGPLHSGVFLWDLTIWKHTGGAFSVASIKPLPTCFLFIKTPSISLPNVWVSTHFNTWKPSCLWTQGKTASYRIWNGCLWTEFKLAWHPLAHLMKNFSK